MRLTNILKVAALAMPLFLTSCHTYKQVVKDTPVLTSEESMENAAILDKVTGNAQSAQLTFRTK